MTQFLNAKLRAYRKDEDGSMVIPVALWVPFFIMILLCALELGMLTVRHTVLERSLDTTVREIRLGTGSSFQHDDIKASICARSPVLYNCDENLKLEMTRRDLRSWQGISGRANCEDQAENADPVREFTSGQDNQLMVLRACYLFNPISPASLFGDALLKNAQGESALIATSAFVQEPR